MQPPSANQRENPTLDAVEQPALNFSWATGVIRFYHRYSHVRRLLGWTAAPPLTDGISGPQTSDRHRARERPEYHRRHPAHSAALTTMMSTTAGSSVLDSLSITGDWRSPRVNVPPNLSYLCTCARRDLAISQDRSSPVGPTSTGSRSFTRALEEVFCTLAPPEALSHRRQRRVLGSLVRSSRLAGASRTGTACLWMRQRDTGKPTTRATSSRHERREKQQESETSAAMS